MIADFTPLASTMPAARLRPVRESDAASYADGTTDPTSAATSPNSGTPRRRQEMIAGVVEDGLNRAILLFSP